MWGISYSTVTQWLACLAPNNDQPGSSPTKGENSETPCDGLVICHNPLLTLTLPLAYTAFSKNSVCNSGLNGLHIRGRKCYVM